MYCRHCGLYCPPSVHLHRCSVANRNIPVQLVADFTPFNPVLDPSLSSREEQRSFEREVLGRTFSPDCICGGEGCDYCDMGDFDQDFKEA